MIRASLTSLTLCAALTLPACDSDSSPRKLGAACAANGQCESGLCGGGICLDPEADNDGDNILNKIEAGLGTNPTLSDSDNDGIDDPTEIGGNLDAPPDRDGDGKIDAIESNEDDADDDCINDVDDPDDGLSNAPSETFPNACGDGRPTGPVCDRIDDVAVGTCARPMVTFLTGCYVPEGACTVEAGETRITQTYANGARIELTSPDQGETVELKAYAASGRLCLTISQLPEDGVPSDVLLGDGSRWVVTSHESGALDVACPGGQTATLPSEESEALGACITGSDCEGLFDGDRGRPSPAQ